MSTTPDQTFHVDAALEALNPKKPLPLSDIFLPSSLSHRPDTCSGSTQGYVTITTEEQRQAAIEHLQALKAQAGAPVPAAM